MKKILACIFIFFTYCTDAKAQENENAIKRFLNSYKEKDPTLLNFYSLKNFNYHWLTANRENIGQLLKDFNNHCYLISDTSEYNIPFVKSVANKNRLTDIEDSVYSEMKITKSALKFYNDIFYGAEIPAFSFKSFLPDTIQNGLADLVLKGKLDSALNSDNGESKALRNYIKRVYHVLQSPDFKDLPVESRTVSITNKPLLQKLSLSGITDSATAVKSNKDLLIKIKEAQQLYNLLADGVFRPTLQAELNVPLSKRLENLRISWSYNRWLKNLSSTQPVIVVNIPSTEMNVIKNDSLLLHMRMVLGKKSTPTPALLSRVNEVILYPYWHVPRSIATKELLPRIKRDPGYINRGNYQVLDKSGNIVDPYTINWHRLSASYFPYLIRQSTGCDNALGLLKLNFPNPYSVYLHDTPDKQGFLLSKRFLSHGCMRMEKPFELGRLILEPNTIAIDTLSQKGCLLNQAPVHVNAITQMIVVVWYNPVGIRPNGKPVFYEDVYGKFD